VSGFPTGVGGRGLRLFLAACLPAAVLIGTVCWRLTPTPSGEQKSDAIGPTVVDGLLRGLARIDPGAGRQPGWGVLLDGPGRLVATATRVVAGGTEPQLYFPAAPGRVAGRVVFRDAERGVALVRVERVPEGVTPPPAGDPRMWIGEELYAVDEEGPDRAREYRRGVVCQVLQPPHYCGADGTTTPWIVRLDPSDPFSDAGAPVVDDRGKLVAVTTAAKASSGVTSLIDIEAVYAVAGALREREGATGDGAAEANPAGVP
jgi:hypothetical protein